MCSPMPDIDPDDWPTPPRWDELVAAEQEMIRQDERWGEQNHPDLHRDANRDLFTAQADGWKDWNANRASKGTLAWDGILLEEVYEALGEPDEDKMCTELVQVAAVALQWVGAVRRRQKARVEAAHGS